MANVNNPSRLDELLAGQVLGDLSEEESRELEALRSHSSDSDLSELELTASTVQIALKQHFKHSPSTVDESLPRHLRSRLISDAQERHFGKQSWIHAQSGAEAVLDATDIPSTPKVDVADRSGMVESGKSAFASAREFVAWMTSAAAILIATALWNSRPLPEPALSFAQQRAELVAQADDLINVDWGPGKHPFQAEVSGDVVWSNRLQTGFMRFRGMPTNDSSQSQYQLWIIDPARDEEPIDGGVFDITSNGEVIVPIEAKLEVVQPVAFAITVEQPGGVVVSTQENLPLLAAVE